MRSEQEVRLEERWRLDERYQLERRARRRHALGCLTTTVIVLGGLVALEILAGHLLGLS